MYYSDRTSANYHQVYYSGVWVDRLDCMWCAKHWPFSLHRHFTLCILIFTNIWYDLKLSMCHGSHQGRSSLGLYFFQFCGFLCLRCLGCISVFFGADDCICCCSCCVFFIMPSRVENVFCMPFLNATARRYFFCSFGSVIHIKVVSISYPNGVMPITSRWISVS